MRYLNLYAGLGGNIELLDDEAIEIANVEIDPSIAGVLAKRKQRQKVVIADAHQYLLDHFSEFDFIWSSPPCQSHSRMIRSGRNRNPRYPDMKLYEEILFLKHNFKGWFVVENVVPYYQPLIPAKKIGRHLFWSNFPIKDTKVPEFKNMMNRQNLTAKKQMQDWLGIHYDENIYYRDNHCPTQVLRNCVHPKIGLHVFEQVEGKKINSENSQIKMFEL